MGVDGKVAELARQSRNFGYLVAYYPDLVVLGATAEAYIYSDPVASLVKARMFGEQLLKAVAVAAGMTTAVKATQFDRIKLLTQEGLLTLELVDAFHLVRSEGNKAVHDQVGRSREALRSVAACYQVGRWYYRTRSGDRAPTAFVPPHPSVAGPAGWGQDSSDSVSAPAQAQIERLRAELAKQRERLAAVLLRLDGKYSQVEAERLARAQAEQALVQAQAEAAGLKALVESLSQVGGDPTLAPSPAQPRRTSAADREEFVARARAASHEPRTELEVRHEVDQMLAAAGWVVQGTDAMSLGAATGVAVREGRTATGPADYLLYVDRKLVGVVEAKREGTSLTQVERQSARYAASLTAAQRLAAWRPELPYRYETTASETRFTNATDPTPRSRAVFSFHRPETVARWMREADGEPDRPTLRAKLAALPEAYPLDVSALRPAQVEAVTGLEASLAADRPRALIQMATGAGKTYTAVTSTYRLLQYAKARRVLFLVDRNTLGRQARDEFAAYTAPGDGRKFTELFNVDMLTRAGMLGSTDVVVSTVQRLYAMLRGEEEPSDEVGERPLEEEEPGEPIDEVSYNPRIPPESFDLVVVDECHRSIYGRWRAVLEYFDAYLVGLTATPLKQTFGFFRQNLVSEYTFQQSVADGVNVDFDVFRIRTELTGNGATIEAGTTIPIRDRRTRKQRLDELDEDFHWTQTQLGKSVVSPPQIMTVLTAFRDKLFTEIFPGRTVVPKTLIFARDDNHAEEVVQIVREVFGRGNDFAAKITYREKDAEKRLAAFRNSPELRIAVTVDMIATGTDVRPLECLLFLRNPRSWSLFEQMKGRGARTVDADMLQQVTERDATKDRFVVVDAVGALDVDRGDAAPLAMHTPRQVSLEQLLRKTSDGTISLEETSTLASRLARLNQQVTPDERAELERVAGRPLTEVVGRLAHVADPDTLAAATETGPASVQALVDDAVRPLADNVELRKRLVEIRRQHDVVIDWVNPDTLLVAAGVPPSEIAARTVESWRSYIAEHQEEIALIEAAYEKGSGERSAYTMLKELAQRIERPPYQWTPQRLWDAYEQVDAASGKREVRAGVVDLIGLIRYELGVDDKPRPHRAMVEQRFAGWLARQRQAGVEFGPDQMWWLERIRDVVATSAGIEVADLDGPPFTERGGIGAFANAFGPQAGQVLTDLDQALRTA